MDGFTYNGKEYGAEFFKDHSADVLLNILNAAATDKNELRDRLGAHGLKIKPLDKIYFIVKKFARTALNISVGRAGRLINFFTFGKGVNKKAVKAHKKERLLPYILNIFLCLFDGSAIAKDMPETVKTVACDVGSLPGRIVSKLPIKKAKKEKINKTTDEIKNIVTELVYPSKPDNLEFNVEL